MRVRKQELDTLGHQAVAPSQLAPGSGRTSTARIRCTRASKTDRSRLRTDPRGLSTNYAVDELHAVFGLECAKNTGPPLGVQVVMANVWRIPYAQVEVTLLPQQGIPHHRGGP